MVLRTASQDILTRAALDVAEKLLKHLLLDHGDCVPAHRCRGCGPECEHHAQVEAYRAMLLARRGR